jgi:exonuclease III
MEKPLVILFVEIMILISIVCMFYMLFSHSFYSHTTHTEYDGFWSHCQTKAGYCGVVTFVKRDLTRKVVVGFGDEQDLFGNAGRVLITDHQAFVLLNCYFPNCGRATEEVLGRLDKKKFVFFICPLF